MLKSILKNALLLLPFSFSACAQKADISHSPTFAEMNKKQTHKMSDHKTEVATFAAGCFWCVEAQFQQLTGVQKVESGFTDGQVANPTYKEVCTGTTGHAEACNITFDPSVISYDELLAAFFTAHDPTQLNRQGNDIGTQYRSGIYYHNPEQKEKAEYYIKRLNDEKAYPNPVVTEVKPYGVFYKAEDYHQDYYNQNGEAGYCRMVIQPKLEKFKKVFAEKLKK
ncbi:MAG: peptide-methionine (S)-S-oxide reductase MsrA [Taibaiella sp.]|jgi:peptide-methionine (S)-S-oxide reductase